MVYPSRIRYKESHPTISVCVGKDLKALIDAHRGVKSYADFVRDLIQEFEGAVSEVAELSAGRYIFQYPCSICGKDIALMPNGPERERVLQFLKSCGWAHKDCVDAKRAGSGAGK
jgi:hypothetical protein